MVVILTRWRRTERTLLRRDGVPPDNQTIATTLGLTTAQLSMVEHAMRARRLTQDGPEHTPWSVEDATDPHQGPESNLESTEAWQELESRMRQLEARERSVLTLRFGLNGHEPMTLKEIGKRLGVTREWVRKIELRAIQKLQEPRPVTATESPARPRRSAARPLAQPARVVA